jgi:hypothetical protein
VTGQVLVVDGGNAVQEEKGQALSSVPASQHPAG